ncbi:ATP-binding protein [Salinibacter ruber]|uniref:ATP-binding protein n=1 Tax=Salinibacter ruber TaxID=146919 RepID=UPI00216871CB|nr:ATP-binding protein [Salinibacter ruber]MCS3642579.1 hypothetical protein [Salinibacter ruber]
MSISAKTAWHEVLHAILEDPTKSDDAITQFIENEVPDEGEILDFKQDLYISASSTYHNKKRQSELIKHFSALANVRRPARFRYLFIGFNDEGEFIRMQYLDQRDEDQILDVDDDDLRNVFSDKVAPSPDFEVFELERNGCRGGVVAIRQAEQVPLVAESTLRKKGSSAFVSEGQAYTRDGSKTVRMGSDDFAAMIRYREELITSKIQDLTQGLSQVIGIPDDQLANIDLNVTQSDDGVPVRDLVTTEAPETVDEELKTAVKGSKGAGGYECKRRSLYQFLVQRDSVDLDEKGDEKIEYLVRASLRNHLHGAYWLSQYNSDIDDLVERIIAEDINGYTISSLERILLVLGKRSQLSEIAEEYGGRFQSSHASEYSAKCKRAVAERVSEYVGQQIKIRDSAYSVQDLVHGIGAADPERLMDQVIEDLLANDSADGRNKLRNVELTYLAANA